jgi:hypothetical protein
VAGKKSKTGSESATSEKAKTDSAIVTVNKLKIGDVFRVVGKTDLWRKEIQKYAYSVAKTHILTAELEKFKDQQLEVVEPAATSEIRRAGRTLVLRSGEVLLQFTGAWLVHRFTPGEKTSEFALGGHTLFSSVVAEPTEETALSFLVVAGGKYLNRPNGTTIFAYKGRVYARATQVDMFGEKRSNVGFKQVRVIDHVRRVIITGILVVTGEFALYDIIQEHFGMGSR